MVIRTLNEADSLQELTDLLHRAYKALADKGLRYLATHQDIGITRERINRGTCFVAESDGRIVGTIVYYPPGRSRDSERLGRENAAHMGQLAVAPELQGRGIGTKLIGEAETEARKDGADEMVLDTAEQATQLIAWYERLGYVIVDHVSWEITNYRSVIMSKSL